ncbi:RNA-guided endonuclease IscB [Streptomyces sp. NPDC005863]
MPCHPARARELLAKGRAVVVRQVPFVIRLKDRTYEEAEVEGVQLRIDPGSKGTGIALTDEKRELDGAGREVTVRRGLVSWEVRHRGDQIQHGLTRRRGYRHRRRSANCRYRAPRSENRRRPDGWLAPSLQHRVDTTHSMARRLFRHAPITEIHVETARFDTHSLSVGRQLRGAEHQLGPLTGTDARTYLYARWGKSCVYCGATDVALNLDHIHPRGRNGTGRVANLVPSCGACNRRKGSRRVGEYLGDEPERLARIREQTSPPLRDAAVMNSVTARLVCVLRTLGSPVLTWPGRETAATRIAMGLEKSHTLDALCVGALNHERGGRAGPGARTDPRGEGRRTRLLRPHHFGPLRLPPSSAVPHERTLRLRHRRHRLRHDPLREVGGRSPGPRGRACKGAAQPPHPCGPDQRLPCAPASPAARGRIRVRHAKGKHSLRQRKNRLSVSGLLPRVFITRRKEVIRQ